MTNSIEVFTLGKKINGKTYGLWTAEWWNYMISSNAKGSGGVFKFPNDDVWFLTSEFVNEPATPQINAKIDIGGLVLCPCDNQFIFSSKDKYEELENVSNLFVNSAEKILATIEKKGGNITRLDPVRVYTSIRGIKYTKDLSRKTKSGENLFYSIDESDVDVKEGQEIQAFGDGHWVFFKISERGVYNLQTYAQMRDFSNNEDVFTPQADYTLDVS
ncbi:MAG TPA: hypothetical protein DD730_07270 [Desulfosporosinus sp.]|nr:hypothetical protein [Desulfosporosinus sp.]